MEAPVARKLREGDSVSVTPSLTKTTASPDRLWRGGFGTITFVHGNARHFNVYGADGDCYCDGRRLSPVKKGSLRVGQLVAVMNSFEGLIQILRTLLIYKGVDLRRRSLNLKEIIGMKGEIMGETATVGLFEVVLSNGRSLVLPASCLIHGESLPYQPGDAWNPCRVRITSDLDKLRRECEEAPDSWHEDLMALLVGVECIVMQHGTGQNLISVLPDPPHDGRPWVLPMSCVALVSQVQQTAAPVSTVSSTTSKKRKPRSDRSTRQKQKDAQPDDTTGSLESRKEGGVDILGPLVSLPKPTCLPPCASPRPSHSQADPCPNTQDEEMAEGGNELEGVHDGAGRNGFETNDARAEPLPVAGLLQVSSSAVDPSNMEKDDEWLRKERHEGGEEMGMSAAALYDSHTYDEKDADPRRMTSGSLHSSTFSEESEGDAVSDGQQGDMREYDQGSEGEGSEVEGSDQQPYVLKSFRSSGPRTVMVNGQEIAVEYQNERNDQDEDISDGEAADLSDSDTYVGRDAGARMLPFGSVHNRRFSEQQEHMRESDQGSEGGDSENAGSDNQPEEVEDDSASEGEAADLGDNDTCHEKHADARTMTFGWLQGRRFSEESKCDAGSDDQQDYDMHEQSEGSGDGNSHDGRSEEAGADNVNDSHAYGRKDTSVRLLPPNWYHSRTFSEEDGRDAGPDQHDEYMRESDQASEGKGSGDDNMQHGSENQSFHSRGSMSRKEINRDYGLYQQNDDRREMEGCEMGDSEGECADNQSFNSGGAERDFRYRQQYDDRREMGDSEGKGFDNESFRSEECNSPRRSEDGSDTHKSYHMHEDVDQSHHSIHANSSTFTAHSRAFGGSLPSLRFFCERCSGFYDGEFMLILAHCGHQMCVFCLVAYVKAALYISNDDFQGRIGKGRLCGQNGNGCNGIIQPSDLYRVRDTSEGMQSASNSTMVVQATMNDMTNNIEADAIAYNADESHKSGGSCNVEVGKSPKDYKDGHEMDESVDSEEVENVSVDGDEVDDADASNQSEAEYGARVLSDQEVTEMVRRLKAGSLIQHATSAVHHNWDTYDDDFSHGDLFEFSAERHKRDRSPARDNVGMGSKVPRISRDEQAGQVERSREYSKYPDDWVSTHTQKYIPPARRNHTHASGQGSNKIRCAAKCNDKVAAEDIFEVGQCGHQVCMACVVTHIKKTLAHPRDYINLETARLPCPVYKCGNFMQESDIYRLQREYYVYLHGCDEPPANDENDEHNLVQNEDVVLTREEVARLVQMLKNAREGDIDAEGNLMEPPAIPSPPVHLPATNSTPLSDGSANNKSRNPWRNDNVMGGGGSQPGGP